MSALAESDAVWGRWIHTLRHEFISSMTLAVSIVGTSYLWPWLGPKGACILFASQTAAALACLFLSRRIALQAIKSLMRCGPRTMATLTSVAMVMAFLHSLLPLAVYLWRGGNPLHATDIMASNTLGSMATLCAIVLGGQLIKMISSRRSLGQAARLARLVPQSAAVVSAEDGLALNEQPSLVPVEMLEPGNIITVCAGERLPADGRVLSGKAYLDQSWMTGDDQPMRVAAGDGVFAGCAVTEGQMVVCIEHCGISTSLGKLLHRISAPELDSRTALGEGRSGIFVDMILLLVAAATVRWRMAGLPWQDCLRRMVSMLVCACPCTVELGVPISLVSAASMFQALSLFRSLTINLIPQLLPPRKIYDSPQGLTAWRMRHASRRSSLIKPVR